MSGNLLKMLGGLGGPPPASSGKGSLLSQLGPPPPPDMAPPDQQDTAPGSCQDCRFWQSPATPGGQLGLCQKLSDMADSPPDETSISPAGARFQCGPDWYCKYFEQQANLPPEPNGAPPGLPPAGGLGALGAGPAPLPQPGSAAPARF